MYGARRSQSYSSMEPEPSRRLRGRRVDDGMSPLSSLPPGIREDAEERAAIYEYLGCLPRAEAERRALEETERETPATAEAGAGEEVRR